MGRRFQKAMIDVVKHVIDPPEAQVVGFVVLYHVVIGAGSPAGHRNNGVDPLIIEAIAIDVLVRE